MTEPVPSAAVEAAQAYEDLHVASLFAEWAPRVLDAAGVRAGDDVLDVACGTGVLAREAARRVLPGGSVAGVDLSPAMLTVAASLAPEVDWRPGDAATIPFEDATFDASVSQFGLMFFTDRPGSIREMLRVVRPGGRVAVAVWDSIESSPVYPIEVELLERLAGPAAAEALRAPFVLGDTAVLTELARSAGVDAVEVRTVVGEARFPSVRSMVEADLRGWLPLMGVHLDESVVEQILAEAEIALDRFVTETGALVFDSPAHILSGSRC